MTTIAYKDGKLAFDSKVTAGGTHTGFMTKGKKTSKFLIAGCGSCEDLQAFIDWMDAGGVVADKKLFGLADREVDMAALVVNKKNMVFHYEGRLYPYEVNSEYHAMGSGADFALGAMASGSSAQQAVRIASKLDTSTGGVVKELSWGKK